MADSQKTISLPVKLKNAEGLEREVTTRAAVVDAEHRGFRHSDGMTLIGRLEAAPAGTLSPVDETDRRAAAAQKGAETRRKNRLKAERDAKANTAPGDVPPDVA